MKLHPHVGTVTGEEFNQPTNQPTMGKIQQQTRIELADKHYVSLTYFNGKCYFHIRHNFNNKSVSLTYADMKSLVDQFPVMRKRMKVVKKHATADDDDASSEKKKKNKKKKKTTAVMEEDDEEDEDEEEEYADDDDDDDDDAAYAM